MVGCFLGEVAVAEEGADVEVVGVAVGFDGDVDGEDFGVPGEFEDRQLASEEEDVAPGDVVEFGSDGVGEPEGFWGEVVEVLAGVGDVPGGDEGLVEGVGEVGLGAVGEEGADGGEFGGGEGF